MSVNIETIGVLKEDSVLKHWRNQIYSVKGFKHPIFPDLRLYGDDLHFRDAIVWVRDNINDDNNFLYNSGYAHSGSDRRNSTLPIHKLPFELKKFYITVCEVLTPSMIPNLAGKPSPIYIYQLMVKSRRDLDEALEYYGAY